VNYMKKYILPGTFLLALVIVAGWAIYFFLQNFSGAYPAVFKSSRDISTMISRNESPLSYPEEFTLSVFAEGLTGPRDIVFDPEGTMLVSLSAAGKVVALPDRDNDGRADRIVEVAVNLNRPHGIAFSREAEPKLFIAETNHVTAYAYDPDAYTASSPEQIAALPGGGNHVTRSLLFMSAPHENTLLISVGSSCNACRETDWRRAKILSIDTSGGRLQTFATGLRNAVFMTVNPANGDIWATEMGRDYLGDNLPPDEINIITRGSDYGWPTCYGKNILDTDYLDISETTAACSGKTPSFIDIQAHSAPLGLDFFPHDTDWPEKYRGNLLVAYHGSWNRTVPTGYKVVLFSFDNEGNPIGREDFVTGWLRNGETALGRPVDVNIRDGVIFISDDKAGIIYRLALELQLDR
jgi:glucose/arabinose dehydrogenase